MTNPTSNRNAGKAFEYRVVDLLKALNMQAERVPHSGSSPNDPGDVRLSHQSLPTPYLIECKKSRSDTLTVTKAWLAKITSQASAKGCLPALVHGTMGSPVYITIPLTQFTDLLKSSTTPATPKTHNGFVKAIRDTFEQLRQETHSQYQSNPNNESTERIISIRWQAILNEAFPSLPCLPPKVHLEWDKVGVGYIGFIVTTDSRMEFCVIEQLMDMPSYRLRFNIAYGPTHGAIDELKTQAQKRFEQFIIQLK